MLLLCILVGGVCNAWGQAAVSTVLWSEDFSGYSANATPSDDITNSHTGTTVYGGVTLTYACTTPSGGSTTKVYTSDGPNGNNNLLISKKSGTFSISGISTGAATELTITYAKSGSGTISISSSTTGVTISGSASGSTVTTNGASTLQLTFTNTNNSSNLRIDDISVVVKTAGAASGTTASPSISGNTPFLDNTTVTITNAASADGADIYYTLNGDEPTTTTSATCFAYSAPFEVSATTTVKAIAKKSTDTNASSVVSKTFSKVTPITVSEALTAIAALEDNGTIASQYVKGIVSTAGSLSSGKITYYISDDGTTTNQLQVYLGKGINDAFFTSIDNIQVGDKVTVFGELKKYVKNNVTTPEFNSGNYLISIIQKPTFSPIAGAVAAGTKVTISSTLDGATIHYTIDGSIPTTSSSVYSAPITVNDAMTIKAIAIKDGYPESSVAEATYTIAEPCATPTFSVLAGAYSTAQSVTISSITDGATIYYTTNGTEPTTSSTVYSSAISITENMTLKAIAVKAGCANSDVAEVTYTFYAALPFNFDEGRSNIENTIGLTQNGLGSDYGSSPKLKFDGTGDYIILKMNEAPDELKFDIKGNSFSGGTFKVQYSVDGSNYSDLESYTSLGDLSTEIITSIPSTTRYIKWIYTNKSSGNVALGNIKAYKCESIILNASGYATFAANVPLDFSDDSEFSAWQITGVSGNTISFSQITGTVAAGTGVLLKGTASSTVNIPVAASGTDISGTNKLTGIATATEVAAYTYYGLSDNKFVKVNAGTVPAGKALLPVSAVGAGVKEFTFIFDDKETGIRTIEKVSAEEAAQIFDLSGRRLSKMQKGINIVNGKKILF